LSSPNVCVIDAVKNELYKRFLYKCLSPIPFRKYKKRCKYLEVAIPKGLHKKILFFNKVAVGQIEYVPAEASGYPILGENLVVLNCIWVLRKAKGNQFGRLLLNEMIKNYKDANGFATIGLESHWSGWFKKEHMEFLGFRSIDSIMVSHKKKHIGECFKIHLMWLPNKSNKPPTWDKSKFLQGVDFCIAHPLYHPESLKLKEILEEC
jgi:hypothetical protein